MHGFFLVAWTKQKKRKREKKTDAGG